MKKKIIGVIILSSLAFIITLKMNINKNEKISIQFRNIEALASDAESGSGSSCTGPKSDLSPYICKCENTNPCKDTQGCN